MSYLDRDDADEDADDSDHAGDAEPLLKLDIVDDGELSCSSKR
jgi:hypothetical protein